MNNLSLGRLGRAVNANADTSGSTALGADGYGSTGTQTAMSAFTFTDMGCATDIYATILPYGGVSASGIEPSLDDLEDENGYQSLDSRRYIKIYDDDATVSDKFDFSLTVEGAGSLFMSKIMSSANSNTFLSWDLQNEGSMIYLTTLANEISASYYQDRRPSSTFDTLEVRCYRESFDFDISTDYLVNIQKTYYSPLFGAFDASISTAIPNTPNSSDMQTNLIGWTRLAAKKVPPGGGGGPGG